MNDFIDDWWAACDTLDGYELVIAQTAADMLGLPLTEVVVATSMNSSLVEGIFADNLSVAALETRLVKGDDDHHGVSLSRYIYHGISIVLSSDGAMFIAKSSIKSIEALAGVEA